MEIGKYYVDGEGFYRVVKKKEYVGKPYVVVECILIQEHSVSFYSNMHYVESSCDRRMAECTEEQFLKAKKEVLKVIGDLYRYNSDVFYPAWETKMRGQ